MKIHDYVIGAVATEKKLERIAASLPVGTVLHFGVAAGELIDMLKKHVFYNRKLDIRKWNSWIDQIEMYCKTMRCPTDEEFPGEYYDVDTRLFHAAVGIFSEGGELLEALTKGVISETGVDTINFAEELGDVEWYQAIAYDAMELNPELNFYRNHMKLNKDRYPDGFTFEAANNRNLVQERKSLEITSL